MYSSSLYESRYGVALTFILVTANETLLENLCESHFMFLHTSTLVAAVHTIKLQR